MVGEEKKHLTGFSGINDEKFLFSILPHLTSASSATSAVSPFGMSRRKRPAAGCWMIGVRCWMTNHQNGEAVICHSLSLLKLTLKPKLFPLISFPSDLCVESLLFLPQRPLPSLRLCGENSLLWFSP